MTLVSKLQLLVTAVFTHFGLQAVSTCHTKNTKTSRLPAGYGKLWIMALIAPYYEQDAQFHIDGLWQAAAMAG